MNLTSRPLVIDRHQIARRAALAAAVIFVATSCGTTASSPESNAHLTKGWNSGLTDTEVRVGFAYFAGGKGKATDEPTGASDPAVAQTLAVIDHINAQGGAAGRTMVPVWHRYQFDAASADAEGQALCTDFTQDREVFVSGTADSSLMQECFAAQGVPQVVDAVTAAGATFDRDPYLVSTPVLSLTRLMRSQVEVLAAHDFFQPDAKIGFFAFDSPEFVDAEEQGLKPALSAHGLSVAEEFLLSRPETPADVAETLAQVASAGLKFRDAGIDHVIFLGGSPQFMIDAEKQGYRPRYAISTWDYPSDLRANGVPEEQLHNAAGIGYSPAKDIADYKTQAHPPGRQQCLAIMSAHDLHPKSGVDEAGMLSICDQVFLIKDALESAEKPVNGDTFMKAVYQLGDGFTPASTWQVDYSEESRDGVAAVRYLEYGTECQCFRYAGDPVDAE